MLKVLQIAQAGVGYREKASAAQLDDKAANAGSAGRIYTTGDENGYPSYSIK